MNYYYLIVIKNEALEFKRKINRKRIESKLRKELQYLKPLMSLIVIRQLKIYSVI